MTMQCLMYSLTRVCVYMSPDECVIHIIRMCDECFVAEPSFLSSFIPAVHRSFTD